MEKGNWYKKASNWLIIVACVILIPIIVINIWVMIQAKTNSEEVPSIFGLKPFIVLSGSMESEIFKGDLIITKVIDPSSLKSEDIIAFRDSAGTVTTHRIIDIVIKDGDTYFITKGDNNNTQDVNLVEYDDVEGLYLFRIPGVGSMMNSLSNPITVIIIFFGITVIFGLGFVISTKKSTDAERKEFLEYKKMMEEQKNKANLENDEAIKEVKEKEVAKKKTTSKKNTKSKS